MLIKSRKKRPAPVAAEQVKESKADHHIAKTEDEPQAICVSIDFKRISRNATMRKTK